MRLAWIPLVVVVWCLAGAGEAIAQDAPVTTDPVGEEASTPKRVYQSLREFGSFGANAGWMRFLSDEDAADSPIIRPSMQGVFRYRFSEDWVGVGEFGFGWNSYQDKGDTVLTVISGTLGLYRHVSSFLNFDWKLGGGLGLYGWNYKFKGKTIRDPDPDSQQYLSATDPGLFTGLELERRIAKHVTLLMTTQYHFLFSANEDDFPTLLGGNDSFATMRFGVNYHFSPYEGILWEREQKRVIRLESGRTGS
jgi:hypothetical protein